ncbi:hypothetical protein SOPP22_02970 [Shewanella sp. OPT22]|nr:hypothetical protein SOPP22_02970 [Shewanella sp. OPT22]
MAGLQIPPTHLPTIIIEDAEVEGSNSSSMLHAKSNWQISVSSPSTELNWETFFLKDDSTTGRSDFLEEIKSTLLMKNTPSETHAPENDSNTPSITESEPQQLEDSAASLLFENIATTSKEELQFRLGKLKNGGNLEINAPIKNGDSLLHQACKTGNSDAIEILIANGADLATINPETHSTPLHSVIESGNDKLIHDVFISSPMTMTQMCDSNGVSPFVALMNNGKQQLANEILATQTKTIFAEQGKYTSLKSQFDTKLSLQKEAQHLDTQKQLSKQKLELTTKFEKETERTKKELVANLHDAWEGSRRLRQQLTPPASQRGFRHIQQTEEVTALKAELAQVKAKLRIISQPNSEII